MRAVIVAICSLATSCSFPYRIERKTGPTLQSVDPSARLLKVHMRNGDVYVLSSWVINGAQLIGRGEHQGPDRTRPSAPWTMHQIDLQEVAVYETDKRTESPVASGMKVFTGASIVGAVVTLLLAISFARDFGNNH